ncbi:MAG: hypothetical protein JW788_06840, partial [Candidatus Omnitrophica bacterium]|nr:hypothetical protein [Candidatus Omnitrophota bacterium]
MQKSKVKTKNHNLKFWVLILPFTFCLLNFTGCATAPKKENLPTYYLNGTSYVPLVSLCDINNISLQYDTFSRALSLTRDSHKIDLMVGERMILVDGSPKELRYPVDFYQGTVVVPRRFREQVLD